MAPPTLLIDGPDAPRTLVLAHGAGAPMNSSFMTAMTTRLVDHGHRVARFEFPYMAVRRDTGIKRPPDRPPVLLETWRTVVEALGGPEAIIVGGKSMGGRMASMIAAEGLARGVVCLGYPFHAPGKPDKPRVDHFRTLAVPALIVQGTRDPFGKPEEVTGYALPSSIKVVWIDDGDHDLKPRKASGRSHDQALDEAAHAVDRFLTTLA